MEPRITPVVEVYTYEHKGLLGPVVILLRIDYAKAEISILEPKDRNANNQIKSFTFGNRGLEYMKGWQDILDGISAGFHHAADKLSAYQELKRKEKEEAAIAAGVALAEKQS